MFGSKKSKNTQKSNPDSDQDSMTMQQTNADENTEDGDIASDNQQHVDSGATSELEDLESEETSEENSAHILEEQDAPKADVQIAELNDKVLRIHAEFENYKRRVSKERIELYKTANQDLIEALLPVLDDLDRAESSLETAMDISALKEGINLVFSKFKGILEQRGLKSMNSLGENFDPEIHEAITSFPVEDKTKDNKIIDVSRKGYSLGDKVIRHAQVVVGKCAEESSTDHAAQEDEIVD